jgi:hypothetical protein
MNGDPVEPTGWQRFRERGHHYAAALRVAPELINEAIQALDLLFQPWLDEPEGTNALGPWRVQGNELKRARSVGGDTQLLELLELVHYLKSIPSVPKSVIDGLKDDHPHTFLQMAFAHRFRNVGATNLVLDPPVSNGRVGDIAFTFDGRSHVAECYVPDRPTRGGPEEEIDLLSEQVLDLCHQPGVCLSIGIRLLVPLTAIGRRFVVRSVKRAIQTGQPFFLRSDKVVLSIEPCPIGSRGLWVHPEVSMNRDSDAQFSNFLVRKDRVFAHDRPVTAEKVPASRIGLWRHENLPPEEVKAAAAVALERIVRRAAKKLAQAKRADGARRVMIVQSWVADPFSQLSTAEIADGAIAGGMLGRSNVEGLLFVARFQGATRHRYGMHPIVNASGGVLDAVVRAEPSLYAPPLT